MMRAKLVVSSITQFIGVDVVEFYAVGKSTPSSDGLDEDNTYAKYTPSATVKINVNNPALKGSFKPGQQFYVDFTEVPECKSCPAPKAS